MTRGQKIIILIIVGIVAIGLIIYFIILPAFPASAPATNANTNTNALVPLPNINAPKPAANIPPPPKEVTPATGQSAATRRSCWLSPNAWPLTPIRTTFPTSPTCRRFHARRLGNTSSAIIARVCSNSIPDAKTYYAVASSAVNSSISPVNDTEVNAKVLLQRAETGAVAKTSYATLDLVLKKIGDSWLVVAPRLGDAVRS